MHKILRETHSSAGTYHGFGREKEIHDFLFATDRDSDSFIVNGTFTITDDTYWPNKITLNIQSKDVSTSLNSISNIQFALKLINNFEKHDIERAMIKYIEENMPEKMI